MAYNPQNPNGQATMANSAPVVIASDQSAITVSGTFWQATQPVSLTSLPSLAAGSNAIGSITNTAFGISGTLPAFASTPTVNIGTISTIATESTLSTLNGKIPSNLTVSATRLLVDGSGVTQPVSGTVTANISGSISNTSFAVTQPTAASLNATVVGTGTFAVQAAQSGTWNIGTLTSITNAVTVSQSTASNLKVDLSGSAANSTAGLLSVKIDQTTDGTTNKVRASGTFKPSYGSTVSMTITNLSALASSATAGWQSARVSNLVTLASDYEINIKCTMANTAPANDKAVYIYICPWYTSDGGTTWYAASQGTTTLPTGSEGTTTIASPNNLRLLGVLNYTTQNMVLQDTFLLSNCFGARLPDGFSIIIVNFSGAALATTSGTNNIVQYTPLSDTIA